MKPQTELDTLIRVYLEKTRGLLMMHDVREAARETRANPTMNRLLVDTLALAESLAQRIRADSSWR